MMGTLIGGCHGTVRGSQMAVTIEDIDFIKGEPVFHPSAQPLKQCPAKLHIAVNGYTAHPALVMLRQIGRKLVMAYCDKGLDVVL